jgi:Ca-activated chloride channel family protein
MSGRTVRCRLLFVAATYVSAAAFAPQRRPITIETEVIGVPITVLDGRGRFVQGLKQTDFEVLEDGVAQELTSFSLQESGITAVLLLDVSGSMTSRLEEAKRAATQFIRQLGPKDVVKVTQFDQKVTPLSEFSSDKALLAAAVGKATVGGATALHNALYTALADLDARKQRDDDEQRHRAIIVLSDGDDTASGVTADEVLVRAKRGDALIYSLSLDRANDRPVTEGASAIFLRELASQTGGQLFFPRVSDLQRFYRRLADELRHQYVLGYVPSNSAARSRWRTITVHVKNRKDLRLRHRLGYFASPGRTSP